MVLPHGIKPYPHVLQTHVHISYTREALNLDRGAGVEPAILRSQRPRCYHYTIPEQFLIWCRVVGIEPTLIRI